MNKRIVITGENGQLGHCLKNIKSRFPQYKFIPLSRSDCDITSREEVARTFASTQPHYVINAAALTEVDNAENEQDEAYAVNAYALRNIAGELGNARCIHISTDYVYQDSGREPIRESKTTDPQSTYGKSKLLGEEILLSSDADAMVIRTSWLYSEYGNNFLKTMIRLSKERSHISVVDDQIGSPTYGIDLADAILKIISQDEEGIVPRKTWNTIYNYCNKGAISWYEFSCAIFKLLNIDIRIDPIPSVLYPTPAKRPEWSVMDTDKISEAFGVEINDWKVSLEKCITNLVN